MAGPDDAAAQTDKLVIDRVRYEGGVLTVSWTGTSGLVPGFLVTVLSGPIKIVETAVATSASARLPLEVPAGETYTVQVSAGLKLSQRVPILTDTSAIERADSDPVTGALTLSWKPAGSDGFLVQQVVNGAAPDPEAVANGGSSDIGEPPPAGATAAAALARVRSRTDPVDVSIGPYGPGFAVPTARPELLAVGLDAGLLSVAWTAVPGADSYRISVLNESAVHGTVVEVGAPATTAEFEPGIADHGSYRVVVQAVDRAGSSGPPSAPLGIPLTAPTVTGVVSDGATVSIDVLPPTFTPTGYEAVLLRDGVPLAWQASGPAATLSLAVPVPTARGAAYAVSVRARVGRSVGPAVTAPAVPTVPEVASVVCAADLTVTAAVGELPGGVPIEAVLLADGVPGTPKRVDSSGVAVFELPPDRAVAVAVAVRGVDGVATGPWSAPLPAPVEPAEFTLARADAGRVTLAWTGPADGTFRAAVGATALLTDGQTADLPLTAGQATVAQVLGVARGPLTQLDLVAAGPRLTAVTVGADRSVTLAVAPPQSPPLTGLRPVVRWDGTEIELADQPVTAEPVVLTLPEDIPSTATIALRGLAGVAVGPPGNAAALLTVAPTGVRVAYDGSDLRVRWDAPPSPPVDRYRISTVVGGAATVLGETAAPTGSWPVTIEDPATAVVVQALVGPAVGAASEPVPVFTEALVVGPSHLAPQRGPTLTARDLTLGLPELFPTRRSSPVELPLDFVLAPCDTGPYAYTLLIPATSAVWDFTAGRDVIEQWGALLTELQPLGLTPYGFAALTEAVSRSMPQTFDETLYFAYGLRFDKGYLDLRPGLVLRAEYEGYQIVSGASGGPLSGFVTTGVADYEVASYDNLGSWTNGLDAFLAALASRGGVVVPDPKRPPHSGEGALLGGGGVFDLFAQTLRLPYTRLVYPATLLETGSPGSLSPQENCVLLAADTLADLDEATENVRGQDPPGSTATAAYLRGRAVVRALVRISVNGAPRLVPVGTTLGNLLAGEGRRPPAAPVPLRGVTMHRPRAAAVLADGQGGDRSADGRPTGDWPVLPGWQPRDPAALELPLLHGDRLELATDRG